MIIIIVVVIVVAVVVVARKMSFAFNRIMESGKPAEHLQAQLTRREIRELRRLWMGLDDGDGRDAIQLSTKKVDNTGAKL